MKEISMKEFYKKWKEESINLLDVRELDEFSEGHVSGSISFPLSQLEQKYRDLDQKKLYYLICHSGMRSMKAGEFLDEKGFKVVSVQGGVIAFPENLEGEK